MELKLRYTWESERKDIEKENQDDKFSWAKYKIWKTSSNDINMKNFERNKTGGVLLTAREEVVSIINDHLNYSTEVASCQHVGPETQQ